MHFTPQEQVKRPMFLTPLVALVDVGRGYSQTMHQIQLYAVSGGALVGQVQNVACGLQATLFVLHQCRYASS